MLYELLVECFWQVVAFGPCFRPTTPVPKFLSWLCWWKRAKVQLGLRLAARGWYVPWLVFGFANVCADGTQFYRYTSFQKEKRRLRRERDLRDAEQMLHVEARRCASTLRKHCGVHRDTCCSRCFLSIREGFQRFVLFVCAFCLLFSAGVPIAHHRFHPCAQRAGAIRRTPCMWWRL